MKEAKTKIKILGSNGWYSTETGNTICTLIESSLGYIVFDAGEGIKNLGQHIKTDLPIFLFLSHFHLDHTSGFHILDKFQFIQPIRIFGQPGTKEILHKFIASPYTIPPEKLKTKIIIQDLPEGESVLSPSSLSVECRYLVHKDSSFGYRLNVGGKIITYCADTGPNDNLLRLAQKADVLIAECSAKKGQPEEEWQHLTPESAAETAKKSNAKRLLLTHFDADNYPTLKDREEAEKIARKIFLDTNVCYDNMEIEI